MLTPLLFDETLLADVTAARDDGAHFHLWWLGQSGFLLKWRGRSVLFDPYLSDSLTKKYAGTDKEHIRMTARCIAPQQLGFVDVVTSSHAHTDHFDAETLVPLARAHGRPLPLVLPAANVELARERLAQADFELHGIDAGESVRLGEFEFIAVAAAHDTIERDALGRCRFLSYIVRFGPWTLYHSGDTRWHDALPHALSRHQPDVVLLPINGHDPARRVAGNLSGAEAAVLAKECGASVVVPHHFEMFEFNTATPDEFVAECARLQQACRRLCCGERWSSNGLVPRQAGNQRK
jgi:L-ascorbate metabolism protein UlaG (beta-lactamase superfamily)